MVINRLGMFSTGRGDLDITVGKLFSESNLECAGFLRPSEGRPHHRQSDYSPGGICEDKRIRGAAGMGLLRQRAKGILQRQRRLLAVC
jgi:hypothetical protein